ncbi:hypothetical protein [Plantactinospora sp. KLBMP9567]|uniref:hypothetical protein n=1 Tax=Plantactinospora sp. KLBMP9567 TaxID=3085900 RepID=UPI0029826604|nr:hypothetical protein [Plantactinospora sp. KLBMP9567]MDW5325334.1 hypothetical protein [Plantactinospora sp. KLBMP9567]
MVRPNLSDQEAREHVTVLGGGDVPIAVWRLDNRDDTAPATAGSRLASRLAQRLILMYTGRGDAVVDFDSDPYLEHATARTYRSYLAIADPSMIAELDTITDPVSLVVLRWPPSHTTRTSARVTDLFAAFRLIMTGDICAIATVSPAAPGQPGTTYAEYLDELLPAARAAGLTHVLQIVAVTAPVDGEQLLCYATRLRPRRRGRTGPLATTVRATASTF